MCVAFLESVLSSKIKAASSFVASLKTRLLPTSFFGFLKAGRVLYPLFRKQLKTWVLESFSKSSNTLIGVALLRAMAALITSSVDLDKVVSSSVGVSSSFAFRNAMCLSLLALLLHCVCFPIAVLFCATLCSQEADFSAAGKALSSDCTNRRVCDTNCIFWASSDSRRSLIALSARSAGGPCLGELRWLQRRLRLADGEKIGPAERSLKNWMRFKG